MPVFRLLRKCPTLTKLLRNEIQVEEWEQKCILDHLNKVKGFFDKNFKYSVPLDKYLKIKFDCSCAEV